ncbi:ubiquitin domain-containing protein UBFD1-like [Chrysoperla carnea]|uniref:ubiquitin domain-containing protein UBFD1-like n=1 Tax=Chrysoperla carnea TaxID=189513 RepID=UPI001D069BBC|nr:ubiquitin domain-containing protein UBFD1-like [Chrysoperla carnea]
MEYVETEQGAGENAPCTVNNDTEVENKDVVKSDTLKSKEDSQNTPTTSEEVTSAGGVDCKVDVTENDVTSTVSTDDKLVSNVAATENEETKVKETVTFKVVCNKTKHDVTSELDNTVEQLKTQLETIIGIPKALQKVMFKGLARDEQTLRAIGITQGAKVMIVGSKLHDVLAVSGVSKESAAQEEKAAASTKEPLCRQKIHRKVLDKGVPDDAMPGLLESKEPLPTRPLSGMLNKHGGKVRLTFKLEQDQVWLGTRERTEKLGMSSIKSVISEPIEGFEHYHIVGLQLGPTEASRYWIYWVPAQYVDAIKDAILGKWQYF